MHGREEDYLVISPFYFVSCNVILGMIRHDKTLTC